MQYLKVYMRYIANAIVRVVRCAYYKIIDNGHINGQTFCQMLSSGS